MLSVDYSQHVLGSVFENLWSLGSSVAVNFPQFCFGLSVPVCLFLLVRFGICQRNSIEGDVAHSQISVLLSKVFTVFASILLVVLLLLVGLLPFAQKGPFGDTWMKITGKLQSYSVIGKSGATTSSVKGYSFKFLDVTTTIREASEIPPEVVRNRILADTPTCSCPRCMPAGIAKAKFLVPASLIGLIGAFVMMLRYWELCLAFPFLAIAYYCFKGSVGLRFTVHVGNYAALALFFYFWSHLGRGLALRNRSSAKSDQWLSRARYATWIFTGLLVCWFASLNLQHAANYHSHVVYPIKSMEVLNKLNEASSPEDFVVTWWDYGSGCWYYGDARTFTSPAHQTFDNFLSSEILRSTSERKAANLSRLKTETLLTCKNQIKRRARLFLQP